MVTSDAEIIDRDFERGPDEEDEDDLLREGGAAVLTGSDWTVETILSQLRRRNIDFSPGFQRREAWTALKQSAYIESLFLGLPVPQLVLAEDIERKGAFVVIDGKQRLISLLKFGLPEDDLREYQLEPLLLRKLQVRDDLEGSNLDNLRDSGDYQDDVREFENQTIRTVVIRRWPNESYLFRVFLRLNTGSLPLSPQELRQALHPGPFIEFVNIRATESDNLQLALRIRRPDFRMRDVEVLIRFYAFQRFLYQYDGNLKAFLDRTCLELNQTWDERGNSIRALADVFDRALETTFDVFGDDAFRRWSGDRFEGRFNRAVFDVMTYYFARSDIAARATDRRNEVVLAFQYLCSNNENFSRALQTTTKSISATHERLATWGLSLGDTLDLKVDVPSIVDGRIQP